MGEAERIGLARYAQERSLRIICALLRITDANQIELMLPRTQHKMVILQNLNAAMSQQMHDARRAFPAIMVADHGMDAQRRRKRLQLLNDLLDRHTAAAQNVSIQVAGQQ